MIFLYKNVVSFWARVFDVPFKNLIIKIFIIIFVLNLKHSNCILISNKEGFNNSQKKPTNNYLVSNNTLTHLNFFDGNKERTNLFRKNLIYKNTKYNEIVPKIREFNTFCFISNRCVTRSSHTNKSPKLSQLHSKFEKKFDLNSKTSENDLESSSYCPTSTVVSGPESKYTLKNPSYGLQKTPKDLTSTNIAKKLNDSNNLQQSKTHSLSDIDIGLIKNVNCDRVIDVKSVFDEIYSGDESNKRYELYKDNLVKYLADELRYGSFQRTINLFYNRWKDMDCVALSRGFRILLTELSFKKKYSRLIDVFLKILPNRFVADIYSFEIVARSLNRTYVDGWVMSVLLISVMKSFGTEFFKRVSTFTGFKSSVNSDVFKDSKRNFVRHFETELHDTHNSRLCSMDSLYNTTIYSSFDSRNFLISLSLFYEKLMMNNAISSYLTVGYKPKLDEKAVEQLNNIPHLDENESSRSFDSMISSCLSLITDFNLSYDLSLIENKLLSIKTSNISKCSDSDWSIYLILRHSLSNIYSTNEIVITNPTFSETTDTSNSTRDTSTSNTRDNSDSNSSSTDKTSTTTNGNFRESKENIDNTIELESEEVNKLRELLTSRTNLSKLEKYNEQLHSLISEKELFIKNSINKSSNTLEKTIDHIREYITPGREIGVPEIYRFLRMLLNYRINGSTAFNLLFMLIPNLTFSKWSHYHIFTCCLEHDFEKGNLGSIDELLQYMIKMDCKPDPGIYDRFFSLCNSVDKPLMVFKHFKLMNDNDLHWETWDRYTSQKKLRISFGMYEQIFISSIKTGKVIHAMKALLHLLEAMKGTYKSIPPVIWNTFFKATESTKIDSELKAIIDQFSKSSVDNPPDMTKQIFIEIPKQKSPLTSEIERILEKYINDGR